MTSHVDDECDGDLESRVKRAGLKLMVAAVKFANSSNEAERQAGWDEVLVHSMAMSAAILSDWGHREAALVLAEAGREVAADSRREAEKKLVAILKEEGTAA